MRGAVLVVAGSFAEPRQKPAPAGFTLPAALLMILLIAALIAGAFNAITEETRIGVATADRQHALFTAESALELTIAAFPEDSIPIGGTRSRPVDGLGVPVVVYVTRLDSTRYWLVAEAGSASPNSGIARKVGVVVRATRRPDRSMAIDRISERAWSELF